jgi:hypothetical protein
MGLFTRHYSLSQSPTKISPPFLLDLVALGIAFGIAFGTGIQEERKRKQAAQQYGMNFSREYQQPTTHTTSWSNIPTPILILKILLSFFSIFAFFRDRGSTCFSSVNQVPQVWGHPSLVSLHCIFGDTFLSLNFYIMYSCATYYARAVTLSLLIWILFSSFSSSPARSCQCHLSASYVLFVSTDPFILDVLSVSLSLFLDTEIDTSPVHNMLLEIKSRALDGVSN